MDFKGTPFDISILKEIAMKSLITIFLIFIFYLTSFSQSKNDSTEAKLNEKTKAQFNKEVKTDTNLNSGKSIKQRFQGQGMGNVGGAFGGQFGKMKNGKDVFIDKDGDGICDQRVNGMGFEQHRKRHKAGQGSGGQNGGEKGNGGSKGK